MVVITGLVPVIHALCRADCRGDRPHGWPEQVHGCPVERNGLYGCCGFLAKIVITGLDPVIHASFATNPIRGRRVDGRIEVRP
jgi:hypothetical protein